jgi:hypothetical protein
VDNQIMRVAALLVIAGCSYAPTSAEAPDPAADANVVVPDGPEPDALPVWTVVETMTIDTAQATPVLSAMSLGNGVTYRLRAFGIANVIDGITGDAEYYDFANPKDTACCEDVGIGIDDPTVDLDTTPDWGPYNAAHIYEIEWVGAGNPISAAYQDTVYGNNNGSLTLEILELR